MESYASIAGRKLCTACRTIAFVYAIVPFNFPFNFPFYFLFNYRNFSIK